MTSITDLVFHRPFRAQVDADGLTFPLHEPWYRSLPVSCLVDLQVWLDQAEVPSDRLTLQVNGRARTLAQCADAADEFWFVQDPALVRVAGATASDHVEIRAHLVTRIPYIMVGPTTALPHHAIQSETFEVVES